MIQIDTAQNLLILRVHAGKFSTIISIILSTTKKKKTTNFARETCQLEKSMSSDNSNGNRKTWALLMTSSLASTTFKRNKNITLKKTSLKSLWLLWMSQIRIKYIRRLIWIILISQINGHLLQLILEVQILNVSMLLIHKRYSCCKEETRFLLLHSTKKLVSKFQERISVKLVYLMYSLLRMTWTKFQTERLFNQKMENNHTNFLKSLTKNLFQFLMELRTYTFYVHLTKNQWK